MTNDLHKHTINLSDGQKRKLRAAYKKRKPAVIGLTKTQLTEESGSEIMLTNDQHKAVMKAIKNKSGVRLILGHDQVQGGLLKEVLEFVDNNVPYTKKYVTPLIRSKVAPLLKEHFVPWLKEFIDKELDSIIEKDPKGEGLRRRVNREFSVVLDHARSQKN